MRSERVINHSPIQQLIINYSFVYIKQGKTMKEKQRGFFMIANDILHYLPQIGLIGLVLYSILRRMTDRNDRCYPSPQTLARIIGVEESQIEEALDQLEALQLMSRLQHINTLNGKETEVYVVPLYPEVLETVDSISAKAQVVEPNRQLSLELPDHGSTPITPVQQKIIHLPKLVDDPPKTVQNDNLGSLIPLLVEQMRETNNQMNVLIERIDRVLEQTTK